MDNKSKFNLAEKMKVAQEVTVAQECLVSFFQYCKLLSPLSLVLEIFQPPPIPIPLLHRN